MTFQDIQNSILFRLRQRGVNFGALPQNTSTDYDPPALLALYVNSAYAEFLSATKDYPIAALKLAFPSAANAISYPLNPLPPNQTMVNGVATTTPNPAAICVYEMTYTQGASSGGAAAQYGGGIQYGAGVQYGQMGNAGNPGLEYYVPIVGTTIFRRVAGGYTRRQSYYGPRPLYASQQFGKPYLDVLPGTSNAGDAIALTICPDPVASPAAVPATMGGALANPTDVPLLPSQFHPALVEHALWKVCDAANKMDQADRAMKAYMTYVENAIEFGSARGEGDAEQRVEPSWGSNAIERFGYPFW